MSRAWGMRGFLGFFLTHCWASWTTWAAPAPEGGMARRSRIIWATWPSGVPELGSTRGTQVPLRSSQPGGAAEAVAAVKRRVAARARDGRRCFIRGKYSGDVGFANWSGTLPAWLQECAMGTA